MTRTRTSSRIATKLVAATVLATAIGAASLTTDASALRPARPPAECFNRTIRSWHTWVNPFLFGTLRYALCRNDLGEI